MSPDHRAIAGKIESVVGQLNVAFAEQGVAQAKFSAVTACLIRGMSELEQRGGTSLEDLRLSLTGFRALRDGSDSFMRIGSLMRRLADLGEPAMEDLIRENGGTP